MQAYFTQPMAYVMIGGILLIAGFSYFREFSVFLLMSFDAMRNPMFAYELDLTSMVVGQAIGTVGGWSIIALPLLTMRLWAEEKRSGTAELLLTFPLRDSAIVFGKFFATLAVYVVLLFLTLLYPLLAALVGPLDPGPIMSGYLGTLLLGAALLSFGFLCSTWTENQLIAGVFTLAGFILLWFIGEVAEFTGKLSTFLTHISLPTHYVNFLKGVIETQDIAYFVLFTLFCLFLTLRFIESARWRG
jgi:ABC-2 type transport system permease protein